MDLVFILTPDRDFAYRWARENAVVNEYELEEGDLDLFRFSRSVEWVEYIFHNRRGKDLRTNDVIMGPIANDTIFDTMGIITSGFLRMEDALKLLMIGPEYTQVAVKTEKAAGQLRWIGAEKNSRPPVNIEEQAAYQKSFGAALSEILDLKET